MPGESLQSLLTKLFRIRVVVNAEQIAVANRVLV